MVAGNQNSRESQALKVANKKLEVTGIGMAMLHQLSDNNGGWSITLEKVLSSPNLNENLSSVGRTEEEGLEIKVKQPYPLQLSQPHKANINRRVQIC